MGGPSRCPSLSPGNHSPPPCVAFAQSVTHPPISPFVSIFSVVVILLLSLSLVFLVNHSGRQTRRRWKLERVGGLRS